MQKECKKGTKGGTSSLFLDGLTLWSPSRGHGTNTVVPRRRASNVIDGALGQLWSRTALNIGGCTKASIEGVRRLWGGLPPHVFISGNPPHPETSQSSRIPTPRVPMGVRGESPFPIPPRAAFGSFRRVERNSAGGSNALKMRSHRESVFDAQCSAPQGSPPAVFLAHLSPFVL